MISDRKLNFCTLFDSGYLSRGLALYHSLESCSENFHLYIFAFDNDSYKILISRGLKNATIISQIEFEDEHLLKVKPNRTKAEYCWTSTSSAILFCLINFKLDHCTYLDADLYFYSSPQPLFEEIGDASIAFTEHQYTKKYDQSSTCGKYCVQFIFFNNDANGLNALNWWKDSCLNWCYARLEDGKFGDQKYLDDWITRFNKVYIIKNIGAGVAPWNIQQYDFPNIEIYTFPLLNKTRNEYFNLIFYHFHTLRFTIKHHIVEVEPSKFDLSYRSQQVLYIPYIKRLLAIEESLVTTNNPSNYSFIFEKTSIVQKIYITLRFYLKKYRIFQLINSFLNKSSR